MDLFQRLLGTLQRTVDYISIFTTYLLGDDTHPRADGSGSTKETEPCRSHHDSEVETTPYGDISPRGNLEAFGKSPIAEIVSPSKEIQEASGKVSSCVQPTRAIVGTSELSCKNEDVGWKFSEPPKWLADAPKPRSSTTGSVLHRGLEGLTVTEEIPQWELGSTTRMGAGQLEWEKATSDKNGWEPEKLLARGQEQEELGRAGETERTLLKEGKEEDEQERPGGVESDGEEQRGLSGVWPGRFQHEVAKMSEDLQSEPDGELIGGATMEDDQQEEPDIEAGEEGVQLAVPDSAECGGDQQEGPEGEVEAGSSPQREPEEMGTLEVQKEDPKEVAKKGGDQQRGLEVAETEEPQPREPEIYEKNEETRQEDNEGYEQEEPGRAKSDREEQRELNGAAWPGRFQPEVAKTAEDLQPESCGQLVGGANMEGGQQEKPDVETGEERVQPAVLDGAERGRDEQGGPGREAEARSSPQWEPEEMVTSKVQEEDPKEVTDGQSRGQGQAAMEEPQQREPETIERDEEMQQQQEEGDEQEEPGRAKSDREEQRGLNGAACPGRFQPEVAKMAEDLRPEPCGQLIGGANMEGDHQEEPDIEAREEEVQSDSTESGGDQQGGPEGEAETGSPSRWEPEKAAGGEESVTEQTGDGTAWAGRSEQAVVMMVEDKLLEAEGPLEAVAEDLWHGEPDGDDGAQQTRLDGAESTEDQQGGQEVKTEEGRDVQWEPEKTMAPEEHLEGAGGQQQTLEGAEKREGHQGRKPGGLVRNVAKAEEEEEEEEQMGAAWLEKDQKTDPEALVAITVLGEVVGAETMEEPEFQGQEPRETARTERSVLHEPLSYKAAADTCCFAGAGLSPDKASSLDTSAQKERVLLNRKSSVRRAPSLKRPKPPIETSPQQETSTEENSPPPPPTHARPNLRHAGFGPMHPNMMAELQTRLRRPQ